MKNILRAAMGNIPCDIVLKNVTYLNVFTNEWLEGDIGILGDRIVGVGKYDGNIEYDYTGKFATPSFIDSHVHIESSLTTPSIFTREILPFGTTAIVADPHEIANVSGKIGLRYMFDATQLLPIHAYIMLPSCVPASQYETGGAVLGAADLLEFVNEPNCLGLGEVMNNSFLYDYSDDIIAKLTAFAGQNIDGHAPILTNTELNAYRACGALNDHETSFAGDVINKARLGFKILARQGSSCKNLATILRCAQENNIPYSNFAYCSDDKHISDIKENGHISYCIKLAIELGIPLHEAYKMASYYPANNFGFHSLGAIAPSYLADIVILDNINTVNVIDVFSSGKRLVKNKLLTGSIPDIECPQSIKKSVHIDTFDKEKLLLPITHSPSPVINIVEGELLTRMSYADLPTTYFNYQHELNKVVVLERHRNTGNCSVGIVGNYCIRGAIASTVSHDSHNITCIGSNDDDIALAINSLAKMNGGYIIVNNGVITAGVSLPIAGLISDEEPRTLHDKINNVINTARIQGVNAAIDPLQPLSFLALSVLPEIRITDQAVLNVLNKHEIIKY